MNLIAFAIACTSCLLVAHGRPEHANRKTNLEIDPVSGAGYLVEQVPSAARPLVGWQKTAIRTAPAALAAAACWVMRSRVVLGQGKAQMLPGKTEGADALRSSITWSTWRVVVALIVLGNFTARQRRKKSCKDVESHNGDTAAEKLTQATMFRICTVQPDAEPEPAFSRSGTEFSTMSEESQLPLSAELFRLNTQGPTSACIDLRDLNTEVQFEEANAESAGSAGVEAALGTKDGPSREEAAAEAMAEEATAGLAAIRAAVTALPVLSETAPAMRDEHRFISPTVQKTEYSHAPNAYTPTMAARSMTSAPDDFSPIKWKRALTSDQPLPSRGPLSSLHLHAKIRDTNMKLVGAPKERIREIANQLGTSST